MPETSPLLCRSEQILFGRLVRAFPGHIVLAQVALSRLLGAAGPGVGEAPSMVADFVVCKADFTAMAVVELVTAAGTGAATSRDQLLQAAGIKVIRVVPHDLPSEAGLRALAKLLPLSAYSAPLMRHAS